MDHKDRAIIMDWFRSYHGAPTDAKFLMLAKRAGVAVHEVAFVWWALLDFASQNDPRGSIKGFDPEALACFSGLDESKIRAIEGVCREKGMVDQADMLSAWHRRQPKREDDSSPRVRAFRERQKGETQGNAHVTQGNAHVTQGNGRTEQNREEQNRPPQPPEGDSIALEFEQVWAAYPKRAGGDPKRDALIAFRARRKEGHTLEELLQGTQRYAKFCEATGKLHTETVRMAKTFFGPSKHFLERYDLPAPPARVNGAAYEPRRHKEFGK
jgi:hypothetical protein